MKQIAVLDLGTNTFHLLIAERLSDGSIKEILVDKKEVKLGEGGITKGIITEPSFKRGVEAMLEFKKTIDTYPVKEIYATGTAALRNASNGADFIGEVKKQTNIDIELIEGDREAFLIHKGVQQAVNIEQSSLIMDIGGGSVEFIFCNKNEIFSKKSYPLGAARLMALFHKSDPINADDTLSIHTYLEDHFADLKRKSSLFAPKVLIGSSGAFETFADLCIRKFGLPERALSSEYKLQREHLQTVITDIIRSTHEERARDEKISPVRVDMIVVAAILTSYVLHQLNIPEITLSTFALKEGLLYEKLG